MQTWEVYITGTGQSVKVHTSHVCAGRPCVIHNPSDHHMRDFPTKWREDLGIMERICPCGIGHPDPDEIKIKEQPVYSIHGCCGCCKVPE